MYVAHTCIFWGLFLALLQLILKCWELPVLTKLSIHTVNMNGTNFKTCDLAYRALHQPDNGWSQAGQWGINLYALSAFPSGWTELAIPHSVWFPHPHFSFSFAYGVVASYLHDDRHNLSWTWLLKILYSELFLQQISATHISVRQTPALSYNNHKF